MPAAPLLTLLIIVIVTNLVLVGVTAIVLIRDRHREAAAFAQPRGVAVSPAGAFGAPPTPDRTDRLSLGDEPDQLLLSGADISASTYDRVVRVASWGVILTVATFIAASGLWPATQAASFALLGLAGLFVLTVHDVLPVSILGHARYVVEGSVAITFATLLLVLTGGSASPFFFAYALIVVGAALVLSPRLTLLVTAFATGGYLVGVAVEPTQTPLTAPQLVAVGVNVVALLLLTYVGMVVAREQRRSRDAAIQLSTVDSLTGLYNRAYLFAAVDREIQRSARSRRGFCLLMMDLDGLKPINDQFGHFQGDRVLRGVSAIIRRGVRRIDTAARYGGDEFVVLLPETDPVGAYVLADKIRQGVADLAIETPTDRIRTSLSVGTVRYPEDGRTVDDLIISADQAMYLSKRAGKNRVVGYGGDGMTGSGRVGTMDSGAGARQTSAPGGGLGPRAGNDRLASSALDAQIERIDRIAVGPTGVLARVGPAARESGSPAGSV